VLAEDEHLQREVQTTAKGNRERGDKRANHIDHRSAVTRCNDSVATSGVYHEPLISKISRILATHSEQLLQRMPRNEYAPTDSNARNVASRDSLRDRNLAQSEDFRYFLYGEHGRSASGK
jgi:hypothetical protein